jgi:PAS domain S-box-containing protein
MNPASDLLPELELHSDQRSQRIERLVSASFALALLIVLVTAGLGTDALRREQLSGRSVQHTYQVLRTLDQVKSALFDAIADSQAFVINGSQDELEQREAALSEMESRLQDARELVVDNPGQQRAIVELGQLADERVQRDRELILAAKVGDASAAARLFARRGEDLLTRRIRDQFAAVSQTELQLLDTRLALESERRRQVMWCAAALLLAAIAAAVLGMRTMRRELATRAQLATVLRTHREFFAAVLDSLPATIFVKHARTLRYLSVNRAAQNWVGRPAEQIIGRSPLELLGAEYGASSLESDLKVLAGSAMVHVPLDPWTDPEGRVHTFDTKKLLVRNPEGEPIYIVSISLDISERVAQENQIRALNADLQRQRGALEAANTELESFSYSVSHDLRSPLRAIGAFSQMLVEDYEASLEPEAKRYLATIRQQSARMSQLIDDLLAFSRLGRQSIRRALVDMEALAAAAVREALLATTANPPQVSIESLPNAVGDPSLLAQVWSNLISNAVKYSGKTPAPVIQVGARHLANETTYYVRDNGAGFDMKYAHKLFGVFQRLHGQDEFSGTGVGLAIVHRVITRHGGRVWAVGAPGEGATFHFSLPLEHAA